MQLVISNKAKKSLSDNRFMATDSKIGEFLRKWVALEKDYLHFYFRITIVQIALAEFIEQSSNLEFCQKLFIMNTICLDKLETNWYILWKFRMHLILKYT